MPCVLFTCAILVQLQSSKVASKRDICSAKFRKVLSLLVNVGRVAEKDCHILLQEFDLFLDNIPVFGSTQFANFDSSHDRLNSFFYKLLTGDAYKNLFEVVKFMLARRLLREV